MIVEFTVDVPTLVRTLRWAPQTQLVWEQMDTTTDGERQILFWAESGDYGAFEGAMGDDPTVAEPRCLSTFEERRLYRATLTGEAIEQSVYSALVEVGGIVQECVGTRDGWEVRAQFPDNDALRYFHGVCEDRSVEFELLRKYQQSDGEKRGDDYGLTEKQHRMLVHAVEEGYYEVPRETDLDSLADDLGISHQAASERLRRAVGILTRHALSVETVRRTATHTPEQATE